MDKLKTRILLFSLLLVLLFSLQAVSATTDGDGNLTSESTDLSICDDEDDVSSDGLSVPYESNNQDEMSYANPSTYSQLATEITSTTNVSSTGENKLDDKTDAIENIKAGTFKDLSGKIYDAIVNHEGILNLTYDFAYDVASDGEEYLSGIPIGGTVTLTINGNNHTISGSDLSGIFDIELDEGFITFNNIAFANAYAGVISDIGSKLIINNCTFINNINFYDGAYDEGGAITCWWGADCTLTNCVFINNTAMDGGAIFMESADLTMDNCVFINNSAFGDGVDSGAGGAIAMNIGLTANNCVFINNIASTTAASSEYVPAGGAIHGTGPLVITNSNFTDNSADNGGAIWMYSGSTSVENCNFNGNNASSGSAIYLKKATSANRSPTQCTVSNSSLLNNRADADEFYVTKNKNNVTITFTGQDNLLNAIYAEFDVSVTNVTYWDAKGIANTGSSPIMPSKSNKEAGQNITVYGVVNGNTLNTTKVTDAEGKIVLEDVYGVYNLTVRHDTDSYYTNAEKIIVNKVDTKVSAEDISGNAGEKTDIKVKVVDENGNAVKNGTATLTVDGKTYTAEVVDGVATFKDVVIPSKDTVADVYYQGNDYYNASSATFSIKISHDNNNTDGNKTKHISSNGVDGYETGNPIVIMLLALFVMVITYHKR